MKLGTRHRSTHMTYECAMLFLLLSIPSVATGQANYMPSLVDKLATSNPPATISGKPPREQATWSKYDTNERKRVDATVRDVIRQSEDLWPELVAHLGDDRYCKTVGIDAGYPRNWSVADVCQHVIGHSLSEAYYRHMAGTKQNYRRFKLPTFAEDKAKLREWCDARKNRKLFELQIEACEWAITEIRDSTRDATAIGPLITAITKEIEELRKTQVAIRCTSSF